MPPTGGEAEETFSPEAIEAGRKFFARPWRYVMSVGKASGLPTADGIEIAFAGRSNVGKSSLLNALTGQKALARTSNTPGRTRELNLFSAETGLTIVDMPGYGYARASKSAIANWTRLIFDYLRGRANLRRVYVLIDARHGLKDNDLEALHVLDQAAVSYQIVLTKIDQLKPSALKAMLAQTGEAIRKRPAAFPEILATSSRSGDGVAALRAEIARLA